MYVAAKCALVMCTIVLVCTLADKRVACGNQMVKLREIGDDKQVRTVEKYVPGYFCPLVYLPNSTKTQCCNQPSAEPCCREPSMFELNDIEAIAVIIISLVFAVLIIAIVASCLLHPRCLCYGRCVRHARADYIPAGHPIASKRVHDVPSAFCPPSYANTTGSDEHSTGVYGGGGVMPDDAVKTRTYVVNKDDPMYL